MRETPDYIHEQNHEAALGDADEQSKSAGVAGYVFSYVDITTPGCEGWLNLFFGEYCIAMVNDAFLARKMRELIPCKHKSPQKT